MIYEFLAEGFEEIEAVAPLGLFRRVGKSIADNPRRVLSVGVSGKEVTSARGIKITADIELSEVKLDSSLEMIILPGGLPGVRNLAACEKVKEIIEYCAENEIFIGAICAAPSILGQMGLLSGRTATCYPGFEAELTGAVISTDSVVRDGKYITAKGAGNSVEFALKLVEALYGEEISKKISETIQC